MVGAALFAHATLHAIRCRLSHGHIAAGGPFLQAIAVIIAFKEEGAGDVDTGSAGLAVIAAAAEIGAQLVTDLLHSRNP